MSIKRIEKIVASDLNSRYLSFIEEKNDASYFLKIAEYGNYLLQTDKIDYVYTDVEKEYKSQLIVYKKELNKFVKSFKKEGSVVVKSFEEANSKGLIKTPPEELKTLKEKVEGIELNHYWNDVSFLWNDYVWVMKYIQEKSETSKEVKKIYKKLVTKEGWWKLSTAHAKAEDAWQDFKNKREISVWWAHFKVLMLAAGVYDPQTRQKYLSVGEELDSLYTWEFKQIQQGQTSNLILVKRYKYEEYIRRLHYYLIGRVFSEVPVSYIYQDKSLSTLSVGPSKKAEGPQEKIYTIEKCGVTYDIDKEVVSRKSGKNISNISSQDNRIKLLIKLIQQTTVDKKQLVKDLKLLDIAQVYETKKNLRKLFIREDFTTGKEFDLIIPKIRNGPYKMDENYTLDPRPAKSR